MSLLVYDAFTTVLKVSTSNHQAAHVNSPDYSEDIRTILSPPAITRHAVYFLKRIN